ncbi:hypothetical protein GCM10023321_81640 [Pseudonocardia eucalypti]|uniref:Thymidylate kinase n=1 Tax=Pseudonocardia eucalypti TaxID=648755 RepID=A0ABP9REH6_9PSEU|nr:dTMP kinase [Pseudonocardia eucalypti]
MSRRGLFVTVDGPGGAGKTTTVAELHRQLSDVGYSVHATTEPSHHTLGVLARQHTDIYHGYALACLVAADRYHHLATEIRPALAAGRIVLCDRYVPSSYVLQHLDGVPTAFIATLNTATDTPDLAVLLTADPEHTTDRIARRGAHSRFEHSGLQGSQAETHLYRATTTRLRELGYPLHIFDTTDTPADQIAARIADRVVALAGPPTQRAGA